MIVIYISWWNIFYISLEIVTLSQMMGYKRYERTIYVRIHLLYNIYTHAHTHTYTYTYSGSDDPKLKKIILV